jgi:hypothetical protein
LIGGASFADSLTGLASGGTWALGTTDTYQSGSNILTFSSFEQLSGPGVPDSSQTTLAATLNGQGQAVLTATVSATDGIQPQGTVAFYQGETLLGIIVLQDGVAQFTTGFLPPGQYTFNAVYSGDPNHNISVGTTDGVAQFTTGFLPPGQYTFNAVYSGDEDHNTSLGTATIHV